MIHMSQVKVPVEQLVENVPADLLKTGKIGAAEENLVRKSAGKLLHIHAKQIKDFYICRKSMDARKKNQLYYIYQVDLTCDEEEKRVRQYGKNDVKYIPGEMIRGEEEKKRKIVQNGDKKPAPVVVGFGPAGMFAALTLARAGLCPRVIERGKSSEERQKSVDLFWKNGILDPESNVQFGEGGAGTFSDGKLNTLVKDPTGRNQKVLKTLVEFGAPSEILYLQKPHVGTDCLKGVVKAIREEIIRLGGSISFETKFIGIETEKGKLTSVKIERAGRQECLTCDAVILATGHSARDTFYELYNQGIIMEAKPFAVGVRIEHPQEMIGNIQYGKYADRLPAADYKLTYQTKEKRGVYSFCMCPGGYVVNASSEEGRLAVNGMSYYKRDGNNANSAIVVTVSPEDFGDGVFAGVEFQRKYEEAAYRQAGGKIPVQLFGDFLQNKISSGFGKFYPQMKGDYAFANVREILPEFVGNSLVEGIQAFGCRMKGYAREDAILSGIESRTSSPVRILRDDTLQANLKGVYPCGEGAGYAGGITSAAMDGMRVAEQMITRFI